MIGRERHLYPGNNTPLGFFSYYHYILDQREADKIICLKGGPGAGKSTFMKAIGEKLLAKGHDIDFMHCSSDNDSLDAIVVRDKKIALLDGTAPHVVDPINPGAVDSIIYLGDYWDEEGIRKNKEALISSNERKKSIFAKTYNYLAAAEKMYNNLNNIYVSALKKEEVYKIAARIIRTELSHKEIGPRQGNVKKYFASAITPQGFKHYLETLVAGYERIYLIKTPIGLGGEKILELFMEGALYRGFDVEAYYCPMKPDSKAEHLLVPQLGTAFITINRYHFICEEDFTGHMVTINLHDAIKQDKIKHQKDILSDSLRKMEELLEKGIQCLGMAKKEHDVLEGYYIPNMDFSKIENIREELLDEIINR